MLWKFLPTSFSLTPYPCQFRHLFSLKRILKKGGTITVIKVEHGSTYYHPRSPAAQATMQFLIDVQASMGRNSLIGRELYPLLVAAGF
jgi:hypothetical protein